MSVKVENAWVPAIKLATRVISFIMESEPPYYGKGFLPALSGRQFMKKINIHPIRTLIERRRAGLLGHLVQAQTMPRRHVGNPRYRGKAWWDAFDELPLHTGINLEDAHAVTFWRNQISNISWE